MQTLLKSPLVKQLLGALVGGAVAFIVYTGYKAASPYLAAWMHVPNTESVESVRFGNNRVGASDAQYDRQEQRNAEIQQHFAAPSDPAFSEENLLQRIADRARELEGGIAEQGTEQLDAGQTQEAVPEPAEPQHPPVEPETVVPEDEPTPQAVWEQEWEESERVPYKGAEALPDSGIALWLALIFALGAAAGLRYRRICTAVLCRKQGSA